MLMDVGVELGIPAKVFVRIEIVLGGRYREPVYRNAVDVPCDRVGRLLRLNGCREVMLGRRVGDVFLPVRHTDEYDTC